MHRSCRRTMCACYIGYIAQAIVNNFAPLLFVMFEADYRIPLSKITLLITVNFCVQLTVDLLAAAFLDRIGYRAAIVLAHAASAAGLALLTVLPELLPDAFTGLLISVVVYAIGGGMLDVILSPIMEACPTDNKQTHMSLLHSFYCWGYMGVVLLSTAFFACFGLKNWKFLALLWAAVPLANLVVFAGAPLYAPQTAENSGFAPVQLLRKKQFWVLLFMMLCAGASEQAVSQWASAFAEQGLGVTKTVGDLAGPMAFAALMGVSRLIFGKRGQKMDLERYMRASCLLCLAAYACIVFVPVPVVGLLGCVVLAGTLPVASVLAGSGVLALGALAHALRRGR